MKSDLGPKYVGERARTCLMLPALSDDGEAEVLMVAEASTTAWSNHLVLASMKLTHPGTRPSSSALVWCLLHGSFRRHQLLDKIGSVICIQSIHLYSICIQSITCDHINEE